MSKTKKFFVEKVEPNDCELFEAGEYIVAMIRIEGCTYCSFFIKELHDEESIRKQKEIEVHAIYHE